MKSRTSCCKPIALRKDIFRFAPVWVLYTIALVMLLPNIGYGNYDRFARNFLSDGVAAFGIVNICYAALCAQLLLGDLYNTKLCYSLHAMPFRREGWLATHLVAGLLFCLVPNLVAAGVLMLKLEAYWFLGLYWLLAVMLQFIFFYGIATVSALLTGNRFAMLAVYAIFNFFSLLLYAGIQVLYLPSLEGVEANMESFTRFSPVVQLFRYDYFKFTRIETTKVEPHIGTVRENFYRYDGLTDGWGYLAILAGVGLAVMALCFWLYRKRHLESAGDFVAFPKTKGPMCLILTFCVTLVFAMLGMAFDGLVIWLAVGLTVGYFCSLMLLERRIKVFRKKTFLHFGILVVVTAISVLAVEFDWFGIEKWHPEADQVKSVTVSNYNPDNQYYYGFDGYDVTLTEEEDIAQILLAHQDILDRLDNKHVANRHRVYLTYTMKSGRVVRRAYNAPASGDNYRIIRHYLYTAPNMLGFTNAREAAQNMDYMGFGVGQIPREFYGKVLEALQKDAQAGYVVADQKGKYTLEYSIRTDDNRYTYRFLGILEGAQHLPALLQSPEMAMGYSDWDKFIPSIQNLRVEGNGIYLEPKPTDYEGLLEALRQDIAEGNINPTEYVSDAPTLCYEFRNGDGNYEYRQIWISKYATHVNAWLASHGTGTE